MSCGVCRMQKIRIAGDKVSNFDNIEDIDAPVKNE